jgi:hypothetical protein
VPQFSGTRFGAHPDLLFSTVCRTEHGDVFSMKIVVLKTRKRCRP